ncbi:MAG: sigma-70 family RNA polymerase sigma factor [Planctomycetes bacterium]|nr:sigma-70 family RNA polymerase sigma factor [Planctomycetota bacterium]
MPSDAPSTPPPSDAELLGRIARRQDREAFAELYGRYERPAHGLLLHIVRDPARAEDALQEAFLNVWRHAGTLRDEANVRGWLLRVVAHEGLRALRQRRRQARQVDLDRAGQMESKAGPGEARGDAELSAALHREIEGLDAEARSLIALYYGGGLSQREIGEALDLTQQAISKKMCDALAHLRRGLAQAGFAAALPLLETGALADAICQGHAPGLAKKILYRVDELSEVAEASRRMAAAKTWGAAPFLGAAVLLLAGAAGWWALRAPATKVSQPRPTTPAPTTASPAIAPAAKRTWRWDFNTPESFEHLRVVQGTYNLRPDGGLENSGCLHFPDGYSVLVFDVPTDRLPIRVSCQRKVMPGSNRFNATLAWTHHEYVGNFDGIGVAGPANFNRWDPATFFITDHWIWTDCPRNQGNGFMAAVPQPGAKLALMFQGGCLLDGLSVEEIGSDELPEISSYLKAFEEITPAKRVGSVALPRFTPIDPKHPVHITFYPKGTPFWNLKAAAAADGITDHEAGCESAPAPAGP